MPYSLKSLFAAVVCLLGFAVSPVLAQDARTNLSREQIEQIVREYLIANPEVLVEAIEALERKQQTAAQAAQRDAIATQRDRLYADPDTPVGGNPKGDVTIIEFFDYRCPYCKQMAPALSQLVSQDGKLRFMFKEFPILGPDSIAAARMALAARAQGKYVAMHEALMHHRGNLDEQAIAKIATAVGLDWTRLKADAAKPEITAIIDSNRQLAHDLALTGTPALVIGDQIVPGAIDLDTLKKLIAEARQR